MNVIAPRHRPGQLVAPLNDKQVVDLDEQLESLFQDLRAIAEILSLPQKKGDLLVFGESGWVRLPAPSSDNLVLTSRKATTTGMVWAAPQGGGGGGATSGGDRAFWFYGGAYGAL